jgi:protein-disulfide isomerase
MIVRTFLACSVVALFAVAPASAETLFKYKDKVYEAKDLSPGQQQTLHDLKLESHMRLESFVEQTILDLHIEELAKKESKPREKVEEELFKIKEPTEQEIKDWFEANKNRLPPNYKLEQIKNDISNLLKQEQRKKSRDDVLAKLRKDGKLELGFSEPVAPQHQIAIDGFPSRGSDKAKLTIVEFADYQCPHCAHAKEPLDRILKKYDGKVRLVFMDFPINASGISLKVAEGSLCAEQQGKYWQYHDLAFEKQKELSEMGQDAPKKLAALLKLDEKKFDDCLKTDAPAARVRKSRAEGDRIGVSGTPAIYINGRRVKGHEDAEIEEEIKKALDQSA